MTRLAFGHQIGVPACVLLPLAPLLQHSKGGGGEAVLLSISGSSYSLGSWYGYRLAKATKMPQSTLSRHHRHTVSLLGHVLPTTSCERLYRT